MITVPAQPPRGLFVVLTRPTDSADVQLATHLAGHLYQQDERARANNQVEAIRKSGREAWLAHIVPEEWLGWDGRKVAHNA